MARTRRSKPKATSTTDPTLAETLRLLSHEFRGEWGILCGTTSILEQETCSPAERAQFEAIQNRATQRLQVIVEQLASLFPRHALVGQLASALIRRDEATWSTARLAQLTPLVDAGNYVLHERVTLSH